MEEFRSETLQLQFFRNGDFFDFPNFRSRRGAVFAVRIYLAFLVGALFNIVPGRFETLRFLEVMNFHEGTS